MLNRSATKPYRLGDKRDLPILYEDDAIVVLDKPAGLLAVPLAKHEGARSVFEELKRYLRKRRQTRPFVVHRIDRDTSGLVVFAKSAGAQERLKAQFRRREPQRVYLAVVQGHPRPDSGTWRDHLAWDGRSLVQKPTAASDPRSKDAISHYRVMEHLRGASLLEVRLLTGRRNQIRVQAALRGHRLVGEQQYIEDPPARRTIGFPRQALHAHRLTLRHPFTSRELRFEAPLPADLIRLIERLRRQPRTS